MPPLFNNNQQLYESELMDSLANKAPRSHKEMMILQSSNPETGYLATLVENWKRADTTDNISMAKYSASEKYSNKNKNKKRSKKTNECADSGKKRRKNSSIYCSLHEENNSHISREWKVLTARAADKDNSKYEGITRISPRNLISCRKKLPIKNLSMKS